MKLFRFLNKNKIVFKCDCCGKEYKELPLCFGSDHPYHYLSILEGELEERVELEKSLCVIDDTHFFHRGKLIIPINDHPENLIFNVWTSISKEKFEKRMDLWNDEKRTKEEPYFGWLQTNVPTYGETINIKTIALEEAVGEIPKIESIEENHKLTIDQQNGISYSKAKEIVNFILAQEHNT